jgi:hypothetical protein
VLFCVSFVVLALALVGSSILFSIDQSHMENVRVKRDLISVKRDLISVKRDLISVKRDLRVIWRMCEGP